MAWTLSSVTRGFLGHGPIAVARAERGLQLSPAGPHVVYHEHILAQAHYVNGDYEAAVQWGRRAGRHNERLLSNVRCFIASLVAAGLMDEAKQVAQRLLQIDFAMAANPISRSVPRCVAPCATASSRSSGRRAFPTDAQKQGFSNDWEHGKYRQHRQHGQHW